MIKLILFDMGGIIHNNTSGGYIDYLCSVSGKSKDEVIGIVKPITTKLSISAIELTAAEKLMAEQLGIRMEEIRFIDYYKENLKINLQNVEFIRLLKKRYKIGSLTNNEENRYRYVLSLLGSGFFDYDFPSSRMHCRKPDKRVYAFVKENTGFEYNEMLFIEDTDENLSIARELGINTILFDTLEGLKENMKKLGIKTDEG
jgi:Predicted hydrolase (HAD superfamily)